MNRAGEPTSAQLRQTGERLLPGSMQQARDVKRRMTVDTRLKKLEWAREKLSLSDIEEVKERAIDLYLGIVKQRQSHSPPRLVVTLEGGRQRLSIE